MNALRSSTSYAVQVTTRFALEKLVSECKAPQSLNNDCRLDWIVFSCWQ
uniref:Uncharacterized protein n=1 Tax=Globisporangium ultimum (strain ATCC 200006 / CBS 805.95 / DAOM BR144) TaxID=431595 RepID=K3WWP6_GLOUD